MSRNLKEQCSATETICFKLKTKVQHLINDYAVGIRLQLQLVKNLFTDNQLIATFMLTDLHRIIFKSGKLAT